MWERFLAWEVRACREPGALDAGTHILAVRRTLEGARRERNGPDPPSPEVISPRGVEAIQYGNVLTRYRYRQGAFVRRGPSAE
jgi:hypothetical protein